MKILVLHTFIPKVSRLFAKACYALIRESFALFREGFALIRE